MSSLLHCSLLLELPGSLERRFWESDATLRLYTKYDTYICMHLLISNLVIARALFRALADPLALVHTWHMHLIIATNIIACTANLVLIFRYPDYYKRNRHRIIVGQRLLRLTGMLLAVYQSSNGLQAAMAKAMNVRDTPADASTDRLRSAVFNLTRPLFLAPVLTAAHGGWLFETKWWLPLQLLTFFLAVFGSVRHQYCRMAADPSSALLLQPTCRAVADLHSIMVAAILGPQFLLPHNRPAACSTMLISARVLGWYAQAVYGAFMPVAAFCTLEWRLKQRWVKETLGGQLVYGPLCWRQNQPKCSKLVTAVQDLFSWLLVTAVCWVLLWEVVTWIVPQLPLMQCQSCEDTGTCLPVTCEGGMCSSPGFVAAAVIFLQSVATFIGHLAGTYLK